uniref:Ribosomal protein L11 n=1 Tax=Nitzschia sp. (in: diatoms) TaxID=1884248 RepID=A0A5J6DUS9_9STRA|nr:ribosomal protein L11 [Nitzschia sp. (in: diatoms)]
MIKKIIASIKLELHAGKATPSSSIGPILGQYGINITLFCKEYNEKTKNDLGFIIPTEITIYSDRSYSFILKTSPTSFLLLKELQIEKGSSEPNKKIIGYITADSLKKIAKTKICDLNTKDLINAINIVKGTAKNMGIIIK